jgi:hypothetical protein
MVGILAYVATHKFVIATSAIVAALAPYFWRGVRWGLKGLLGWLFIKRSVDGTWTADVLLRYLNAKAKSFGLKDDMYHAEREHVKSDNGDLHTVFYLQASSSYRLFLYKGSLIFLTPAHHDDGNTIPANFRFLRGTVDWTRLLLDAADFHDEVHKQNEKSSRNFKIVHHIGYTQETETDGPKATMGTTEGGKGSMIPIGWPPEDLGLPTPDDPIDTLALSPGMARVFKSVRFWRSHKEWYRERALPWRRGFLLYGRPGNGKTSLVRAVAEYLDIPVHVLHIATMDAEDFEKAWKETKGASARIVLLEDFDAVFHGRENVIKESDLTFDFILNTLDGIEREDGLLLFVTTNDVSKIDPALGAPTGEDGRSTRPGRIDEAIFVPDIDFEGRLKLARRIVRNEEDSQKLALEGEGDSAVQFQERCRQFAEDQLWSESL